MEKRYALTDRDEEMARLGEQQDAWAARDRAFRVRAGLKPGMTALDAGCGAGWATLALADEVGPSGRVVGLDFLEKHVVRAKEVVGARSWVELRRADLTKALDLESEVDFAWCRWVFMWLGDDKIAWTRNADTALANIRRALKPRGTLALHEYCDHTTWRLMPRSEAFERLVQCDENTYASGPYTGARLVERLEANGFVVENVELISELTRPGDRLWDWLASYVRTSLSERFPAEGVDAVHALKTAESVRSTMITPLSAHIIARLA